jgi:hypothetical protein
MVDRVFGPRLFSLQSVSASASLGLASLSLFATPLVGAKLSFVHAIWWWTTVAGLAAAWTPIVSSLDASERVLFGCLFLLVSLAPAAAPRLRHTSAVAASGWFVLALAVAAATSSGDELRDDVMIVAHTLGAIALGIGCDVIFLLAFRVALRHAVGRSGFYIAVTAIGLSLVTVALTVGLLEAHGGQILMRFDVPLSESYMLSSQRLLAVIASTNMVLIGLWLVYAAVLVSVIAHPVLWFVLERPIYAAQRYGLLEQRKWLIVLALLLLASATGVPLGRLREALP